jgi:hypothetical protein
MGIKMAELTIVLSEQCIPKTTANIGGYIQTGLGNERRWPQCSCKSYQFSKTTVNFGGRMVKPFCKHIEQAMIENCSWHKSYSPEAQNEPGKCPVCGNDTEVVEIGV